jgi:hypothetical protein
MRATTKNMSDRALQEFKTVRQQQLDRYQARRIRSQVENAKGAYDAGIRWPFELLQNATDAGPRAGREHVSVSISFENNRVRFTHDGAPFTLQELAALLSGGSSKDFESDQTTGRFGTGFLVTHVLAEQTHVRGLLQTNEGLERFDLTINRAGDEDQILKNIEVCNQAISAAEPVLNLLDEPSAIFEYVTADTKAFSQGVGTLKEALPFLFATRMHLGPIEVCGPDGTKEAWCPDGGQVSTYAGKVVIERSIRVDCSQDANPREFAVFRLSQNAGANASLVFATRRENDGWRVHALGERASKIYIRFPLRSANFLSTSFLLDGTFDPDPERNSLRLTPRTKSLVSDVLGVVGSAVTFAMDRQFLGAHLLAQIGFSEEAFRALPAEEKEWWSQRLRSVAATLAIMPLVETRIGKLPAVRPSVQTGDAATFISFKWSQSRPESSSVVRLWPLIDTVKLFFPPLLPLAEDWSRIAERWRELGIKVEQISLETLSAKARANVRRIEDLPVTIDPWDWIASLFDVVGEIAVGRHSVDTDLLEGLLPDQHGRFCSILELQRDAGISEELKDIADEVGLDVRSKLLNNKIVESAKRLGLKHSCETVEKAIFKVLSEKDVVDECVVRLEKELAEAERLDPSQERALGGSIKLLAYQWNTNGHASSEVARKCPLVALDNYIVRWSPDRMMMAPVADWDERARPFHEAYPARRVLSDIYRGSEERGIASIVEALVAWGIAYKDPLGKNRPRELKDERLAALATSGQDTSGLTVSGEELSQICLLQPEVINHCRESIKEAQALFGLVLCYVARVDPQWQSTRLVSARRAGSDVEIRVCEALWLADLISKAWVPIVGEGGKTSPSIAKADSLKALLQTEWLVSNPPAVALLTSFFGFDKLELQLLGVADSRVRQEIRNKLARLIELAEANPAAIEEYSKELEERQQRNKEIQRCRTLGLAVQSAVREALELRHLRVELVDRGFDFEVTLGEEAGFRFEVGPFLVEVKTTTSGEVRMTPTQAGTASTESQRYFLCVIDLRSVSRDRLDGPWAATDIEPYARIIGDVGLQTKVTYDLVEIARGNQVGIRNDKALRYAVPVELWASGLSIAGWINQIANALP